MSHRDNYKASVPSVTELLKWVGYYDQYRDDPTGYYFKRGHFIEACGTILLQGQELDERTDALALEDHTTPSGGVECWMDYLWAFKEWISQHKIKFIGAQVYTYNFLYTYQGTLDWLLEIDGTLTVVDCKTGTCPKCTALQTAGYAMALTTGDKTKYNSQVRAALERLGPRKAPARLGLQLEPGKCTPHPYDNFRDYDAFRSLVGCWWLHGPQSTEYR